MDAHPDQLQRLNKESSVLPVPRGYEGGLIRHHTESMSKEKLTIRVSPEGIGYRPKKVLLQFMLARQCRDPQGGLPFTSRKQEPAR